MNDSKDHYRTLNVKRNSTQAEIKKAYRTLAKKYHPDVNENDSLAETKFKEVSEAYSVLGDSTKRAQYDSAKDIENLWNSQSSFFSGFSSGFYNFKGETKFRRSENQKKDILNKKILSIDLGTIDFEDGYTERTVTLRKKKKCTECNSSGKEYNRPCLACNGKGFSIKQAPYGKTTVDTRVDCALCQGKGILGSGVCKSCAGNGVVFYFEKYKISTTIEKI